MGRLRILGVMTGTSCDGVDLACLQFDASSRWKVLWTCAEGYPSRLKTRVLDFQTPGRRTAVKELLELDRDLGAWYAAVIRQSVRRHPSERPDVVANHGQTVAHYPGQNEVGTTLQLGDPAQIAQATKLTVITRFRNGDMAALGQGAPLVPRFHRMILEQLGLSKKGAAIHNLGGISNFTYVQDRKITAFDTGPANIWIDAATRLATRGRQSYDRGGLLAAHGVIDVAALKKILAHPYFALPPPKSTGRDDFPVEMLLSASRKRGIDLISTATAITAWTITLAYRRWILNRRLPLKTILFCGGGAKNAYLLALVQDILPEIRVRRLEEVFPLDTSAVESAAFAYLGYLSLQGQPVGGEWTGARAFGPPGWIVPGENWRKVCRQLKPSA